MNLELNERQLILKQAARDFFQNECPLEVARGYRETGKETGRELWSKLAELGWLGLAVPEQYGGQGSPFADMAVSLLEEAGRVMFSLVLPETLASCAMPVAEMGSPKLKERILPGIAAGSTIAVLAVAEDAGDYHPDELATMAVPAGDGYSIQGTKPFVACAPSADVFVVAARTRGLSGEDGITAFAVDAKQGGIRIEPRRWVTGRVSYNVVFDGATVSSNSILGDVGQGWRVVSRIASFDAAGKCAFILGSARRILELTVEIAKTRVQFGQPIGSFQAIQHQCANMVIDIDAMHFSTYQAESMLSLGLPCDRQVSIARVWCSEAYKRVAAAAVQVHGGVGFTRDHEVGLHFLQAQDLELPFGHADYYRRTLARELLSGNKA